MFNSLSPKRSAVAPARRKLLVVINAAFVVLLTVFCHTPQAAAQVSLTTLGTPYTQNFDTLPASGSTTWTNNSNIPGWFHARTGTGTTIVANDGSSNAGNLYSYGTGTATDRALGSVGSGNAAIGNLFWGVRLQNNTGATITSLNVSYTGEQWRNSAAAAQTIAFSYLVGSPTVTGSLAEFQSAGVAVPSLDFTSPITGGAAGALNGNLAANRVTLTFNITGLSIPNGTEVMLRWSDPDHIGADHGLSIDDFSVTPNGSGGGATISVNDVSMDEGNGGGTTSFGFTISISTTSHGGVTGTISTADGTAQDGSAMGEDTDYVALSTPFVIPNGSNSLTVFVSVNADAVVEPNETFFVNLSGISGSVTVADGQGQGTIVNDDITLTLISAVQGSGAASPLVGNTVTVRGIVTLLRSNGFFIQEEAADSDGNADTSEGIFVFTSSAPTVVVGDQATVTATVAEFNGLTELTSPTVGVNSTGNTLPTAVALTAADLPTNANFAQPQLEKYEGMRVSAESLTTVAPNDSFFDVPTVITGQARPMREPGIEADATIPPDPTSGMVDPNIAVWDLNPERLSVDTNGRSGSTGETITSNVTITNIAGLLDYSFGAYRLIPEAALTRSTNMSAIPVPTPNADEFMVVGYNIENFNNNATQRAKAALTICNVLRQPDIIGTVEIFDLADLEALATEVQTVCGATYSAHLVEQDGTSEDSDQDVGFLVKTSRVTVNSVTQEREEVTYEEPGGGTAILHDRPPLVLDATVDPSGANPQHVIVIVNHLRSFIDIELVAGDGPRVREKRKKQAEDLADLLNDLQTANPGVPVISVGDYNAFQFSSGYDDSVSVIKGTPTADDQIVVDQSPDLVDPNFYNLLEDVPAAERYSFVFEGTPQALDHHLVNNAARMRNTRTTVARVNADFPEVTASVFASNASIPERNSDHDPVVSYYRLGQPQAAGTLVISEFRFRGPGITETTSPLCGSSAPSTGGATTGGPVITNAPGTPAENDEFVELYNNTDSDLTVQALDGSGGWAVVASDGVTRFVVPDGTVIPARGHYVGANSDGYSLACICAADISYTANIPDDGGVALFRTANPAFFLDTERLDAAGYSSASALYREGAGLPTGGAEFDADVADWSFFRNFTAPGGRPIDTGDNLADFLGASTDGAGTGLGQRLGAPGPENLASPIERNGFMPLMLLDATKPAASAPNRTRDFTSNPMNNSTFGTLTIRRRVVNNTGQNVTQLRFRLINLTTFPPATPGTADLRAITSSDVMISDITDAATCAAAGETAPCTITVSGTILDEPPTQPNGGGWNSTLSVPVSLSDGDSVNVQFVLGIQQTGAFKFYINVEVGTESITTAPRTSPLMPKAKQKAPSR